MTERLYTHRNIWNKKKVLREIYADFYRSVGTALKQGPCLEIGGGFGNLKEHLQQHVVSIDIQYSNWLDVTADAQNLPFGSGTFDNIVMIDVLHHLDDPLSFFQEAQRVLRDGGKMVMLEPGITPLSYVFYNYFHEEDVDMNQDIFEKKQVRPNKDPYESNQAIPTLLFIKSTSRFKEAFPALCVKRVNWLSLFAYPLSGGFKPWSLLPAVLVRPLLSLERVLLPAIGRLCAFRLFIELEKI